MPAIGFVSDTIASEPFAGELIRGGMSEAAIEGHTLVVAETGGARGLEISLIQELLDRGVEQFIYAAVATRDVRIPDVLLDRPTVLANCIDRRWRTPAVVPDDRSAGALAARTLLDAGHADAIWLVGEVGPARMRARIEIGGSWPNCGVAARAWPATSRVAGGHQMPAGR